MSMPNFFGLIARAQNWSEEEMWDLVERFLREEGRVDDFNRHCTVAYGMAVLEEVELEMPEVLVTDVSWHITNSATPRVLAGHERGEFERAAVVHFPRGHETLKVAVYFDGRASSGDVSDSAANFLRAEHPETLSDAERHRDGETAVVFVDIPPRSLDGRARVLTALMAMEELDDPGEIISLTTQLLEDFERLPARTEASTREPEWVAPMRAANEHAKRMLRARQPLKQAV